MRKSLIVLLLVAVAYPASAQLTPVDVKVSTLVPGKVQFMRDVRQAAAADLGLRDGIAKGGPTCTVETMACNTSLNRTLATTDCILSDGTFVDFFEFFGFAGDKVTVNLTSSQFDTFLFLLDPVPNVVASDDDSGGGTNSFVSFVLTETGTWAIAVNGFAPSDVGNYTVSLECEEPFGGSSCVGRAGVVLLQNNRFAVGGAAFRQGLPSDFFIQNICSPGDVPGTTLNQVSQTAAAFYFNPQNAPVQEGFVSIRDECNSGRFSTIIEVASASTRRFFVDITDLDTGITGRFENPVGGQSAFFPADSTVFVNSCPLN